MTRNRPRILLVEHRPVESKILSSFLQSNAAGGFLVQHAGSYWEARLALEQGGVQGMLVGLNLPEPLGVEALQRLRAMAAEVPVIAYVDHAPCDTLALSVLKAGADDCLALDEITPALLKRSLRYAIARSRIRWRLYAALGRLRRKNSELLRQSHYDPLTRLLNRRGFARSLAFLLHRQREEGGPLWAMFIDLDDFKAVNDQNNHAVGDRVLRAAAQAIGAGLGDAALARVGGDEFLALVPGLDKAQCLALAEKVRLAVAGARVMHQRKRLRPVTASIALVPLGPGPAGLDTLMLGTQSALKRCKLEGKNKVVLEPQAFSESAPTLAA